LFSIEHFIHKLKKGELEREQTYTPIINALLDFYKDIPKDER